MAIPYIDTVTALKSYATDSDRLDFLCEEIEETYFDKHPEYVAETDNAWDAMHRLLSNGELSYFDGPESHRFAVIGGEPIYSQGDYIMSLKTPEQVNQVSIAIGNIGEEEFRSRYDSIDEEKYGCQKSEEDFEYTWGWFSGVVNLYKKVAEENRFVLFTADQ